MEQVDNGFTLEVTNAIFLSDSEADMGFMYNPSRNAFECQKSNTIPTLKGYYYPFKLQEPEDE